MNYTEAIGYIRETAAFGSKLGLDNIKILMSLLNDPQDKLRIIHIAGTNGKGSVVAFLSSVLEKSGYRAGIYTSPELSRFTERIRINRDEISEQDVAYYATKVRTAAEYMDENGLGCPTEFEIVMAMAFCYFADRGADPVILEVGMGGRLDATNVIKRSVLSVITKISYDHMQYLGESLPEIAREKAGIIKEGGQVLVYPADNDVMKVYKEICSEKKASLYTSSLPEAMEDGNKEIHGLQSFWLDNEKYLIRMAGVYEKENAALAVNALKLLSAVLPNVNDKTTKEGIKEAIWPGRFEILKDDPLIIADGAHNVDGAEGLSESLERYFGKDKVCLCMGILKDKQYEKMLRFLLPHASSVIICEVPNPRSLKVSELKNSINRICPEIDTITTSSLPEAAELIKKPQPEAVANIICGSLYLVGPMRDLIKL